VAGQEALGIAIHGIALPGDADEDTTTNSAIRDALPPGLARACTSGTPETHDEGEHG
jgi:hypothetical protein